MYTSKPKPIKVAENLIMILDDYELYTNVIDIHNYLFALWCKYFEEKGEMLFEEKFVASPVGPKVQTVRDRLCVYAYEIHPYGWKREEEDLYLLNNLPFIKKLYNNRKELRKLTKVPSWTDAAATWNSEGYWDGGFHKNYSYPSIPYSKVIGDIPDFLKELNALD